MTIDFLFIFIYLFIHLFCLLNDFSSLIFMKRGIYSLNVAHKYNIIRVSLSLHGATLITNDRKIK